MLPLFKGSKAVSGEAECDITMIREVIVRVRLVSDSNTLFKKNDYEAHRKYPWSFQACGSLGAHWHGTGDEQRRCGSTLTHGDEG